MDSPRGANASDEEIKGLITLHESVIRRVDEEIDDLMKEVRRLQFKKYQVLEKIKECKGRLTLARRLPPEILATIFELCARDGWTRTPPHRFPRLPRVAHGSLHVHSLVVPVC